MVVRLSLGLSLLLSIALAASHGSAQERAPDACGMTDTTATYGPLAVGAVVTLQRHRAVEGDDNWLPAMERSIGRAAHVTRLSGVDAQGCPGVRVDVDGGVGFWRVRDLGIGLGLQPLPEPHASSLPQECRLSDQQVTYGGAGVGATVRLGRHRAVDGDANWSDEMMVYVGRAAHVVAQEGVDGAGCPVVHVDVDGGQWYWRVRDLELVSASSVATASFTPSIGISSDHGRAIGIFGSGGINGPDQCGLAEGAVVWSPIAVGVRVVVGRHREVNGDANWDAAMDRFVGMTGRVLQLSGVDEQGCPVVHIDLDRGGFYWRVRDMTVVP